MFAVVAPEGKVDFDPALLTSQTMGAPWHLGNICLLLTFNVGILNASLWWLMLPKCATCGLEFPKLETCQYCGNAYCEDDYPKHMALERRHAGLAEEEGRLWRKRRQAPD